MQTPLLMAFIKELLRVHPPLHSLMRKIILDCPVPATVGSPAAEPHASASFKKANEGVEYVVPKGEFVLAAPGFSQLDEKIWGEDAKEFNADRWLDASAKVPGEEDEGEEDYGWGKISKGGKSACAFYFPSSFSPSFLPVPPLLPSRTLSRTLLTFTSRRPPLRSRPPPLHRRAIRQRPARYHHRHLGA
jgi:hypothetical protein